ncbi:MAG: 50S ribosomal protein L10 [Terrimicrobiaceae bacterium]|nr:50S ribosomal protein L10 [Terrimicrobiaceae bacterium]
MRPEKASIVEELSARLKSSPFAIVTDFTGMKVAHFEELRTRLAAAGAACHVVKNSFLKRSLAELGLPDLKGALAGQSALVTGESDICAAAKVLKNFASEFEKPKIKAGVLDNAALAGDQILALADLPSKDALRAQLLGLLAAPATRLVRVLNEPGASLARLLKAKAEKEGGAA